MIDRAVIEQALEALEYMAVTAQHCVDNRVPDDAIEALRTALGQQYMTNAAGELEPVTIVQTGVGIGKPAPVAWLSQGGDVSRSKKYFEEMGFFDLIPLYTDPLQRKPLSDEELDSIIENWWRDDLKMKYEELARAIEWAHGIGA